MALFPVSPNPRWRISAIAGLNKFNRYMELNNAGGVIRLVTI